MPLAGSNVIAFADVVQDHVGTEETTTSTSYTDLTTSGPAVTVAIAAGEKCLVIIECGFFIDTSPAGARARMAFAVSGAETIAATDTDGVFTSVPADYVMGSRMTVFTATTGGNYTFTTKYKIAGAVTGTFSSRRIIAIPLP